ncbi:MAG: hypothetical protein IBX55_12950 [Methyloprofundus sp.]|nr:hypothetical protein [Methyloprofundus sp.]
MCVEVLREEQPIARKDHICNSSEILIQSLAYMIHNLTFAEKREIVKARRNNWAIKKGERYNKQVNKMDGEIYDWKSIPAIHKICIDHDLYQC